MVNVPFGPSTEFFWAELALSLVEFISANSRRENTHKNHRRTNLVKLVVRGIQKYTCNFIGIFPCSQQRYVRRPFRQSSTTQPTPSWDHGGKRCRKHVSWGLKGRLQGSSLCLSTVTVILRQVNECLDCLVYAGFLRVSQLMNIGLSCRSCLKCSLQTLHGCLCNHSPHLLQKTFHWATVSGTEPNLKPSPCWEGYMSLAGTILGNHSYAKVIGKYHIFVTEVT